jgi:uncharacterized protein YndB with AHSA1/START domain
MTVSLTVKKFIRARPDKVFAAWVTPEIMNQWFCPAGLKLAESSADPRVGGSFHAVMTGAPGTFSVRGTYREITPSSRLVFSHRWDEPDAVDTLVTVEFAEQDGGTQVTLTHAQLRNEESARGHEQGWSSTLDSLAAHFAKRGAP